MNKCACSRDNCIHLCYGGDKLTKICGIDGEVVNERVNTCSAYKDKDIMEVSHGKRSS